MAMELKGKKVLVVGLGMTGVSVVRFLKSKESQVMATDIRPDSELTHLKDLEQLDINVETGGHSLERFLSSELIVLSPGIPQDIKPVNEAKRKGVKVISEIELAYNFLECPIIAVTGTNGKTTTTSLLGSIFSYGKKKVWVGGNIGKPLIDACIDDVEPEYIICEVSSFQLEGIERFSPFIGILLNITEDHMDRYPSFRDYAETKFRLFMNQKPSDYAVLNGDDPIVSILSASIPSRAVRFSTQEASGEVFLKDNCIILRMNGVEEQYPLQGVKLKGIHNIENIMSAVVTARLCGIEREVVISAIEGFDGLPHRMEFVRRLKGVSYYNDSKGTNTGAVIRAIESVKSSVVLILGGKDKGIDYGVLKPAVKENVRFLIIFGEARDKIYKALNNSPLKTCGDRSIPSIRVDTLDEAVAVAYERARSGDVVLFSPACSSFDMFRDYSERGDRFKSIVNSLIE